MVLDIDFVRTQFPAFSEPSLAGVSFFDNAAGSFPCAPVVDRLARFYRERKVQPYASYEASRVGGEEMDEARRRMAAMLGVETDEVSFGPSTTQNVYVLAQAFRQYLQVGDAIVVTNQDHEANSGAWRRLADEGIEIREWQVDPETGHLDVADLEALLDDKVKLVCFPHCSNIVGEINDAAGITALVHGAGAFVCIDGVSYAPHGFPNIGKIGADIYMFSSYKTYGPHQGIMVIRRDLGFKLPNQAHWFNGDTLYYRFTPAGPDHAQVAACAGMADYVDTLYAHHGGAHVEAVARCEVVHDLMQAHEVELAQPLLDYLAEKNSVRLIGPRDAAKRAPTIAVVLEAPGRRVAEALAPHGINLDGGDFYAGRLIKAVGVDPDHGVLRMSFVHYANKHDLDRLLEALEHVL
ncbi:MAG: aminotransferase class V-fold PLP-dependent enzyme [Paracoccaceae bacterium]